MTVRAIRIAIAFDIFLFALITLGSSQRNETISSAVWSLEQDGKWQGRLFRPCIDAIFNLLNDKDHCQTSWENERQVRLK